MNKTLFLGIDTSTTASKALLIDEAGQVAAVASSPHTLQAPHPLWSEQEPEEWWTAVSTSIRAVLEKAAVTGESIAGVGLTGQMHGLVLLDKNGRVLRPAILWNDQRTAEQCDEIRARIGRERLIQITGNDALTGFTAPKILWVQQKEPDIYDQIAHILLPKDYVRLKLTGEYAIDKAGGAGTILFDLKKRDWSPEVLAALDINPNWLPPTFEGTAVTGTVNAAAAEATGLKAGIPVFGGGGDQATNAVGTGAVVEGIVALSLGTSGVVFASSDGPFVESDGRLHAFCHAVPDKWHMMGVMLSAAGSLRWFRDTLASGMDFDELIGETEAIPPGSDGLFFLPYLTGERTPHPDPQARAAFVGLTVRHSRPHMTRAVLEGVAYGLRDSFELMKNAGITQINQVRISGGGAKSPHWRQILADVFQADLVTVNTTEGAAYGAALLAAAGTGTFASVKEACQTTIKITGTTTPSPKSVIYQELYPLYTGLYPMLKPLFVSL